MRIVDLSEEHESAYCVCLEDWSDEMAEAGDHKRRWYETMRERGLRVKLALDGDGRPVGMIQYLPIEHSFALGEDLYVVLCIWVHGYEQGVGNHQGHGIGAALLAEAERDAAALGAKGLAAWGLTLPFWMRSSWFKKHGYVRADKQDGRELVWKPFVDDATPPQWVPEGPAPERVPGQVTVTAYLNGWCPAGNLVYERARRAAEELGPAVVFETIDTTEQSDMVRHGRSDGVFVDGKALQTGAPPSYAKIRTRMEKRLRRARPR